MNVLQLQLHLTFIINLYELIIHLPLRFIIKNINIQIKPRVIKKERINLNINKYKHNYNKLKIIFCIVKCYFLFHKFQ